MRMRYLNLPAISIFNGGSFLSLRVHKKIKPFPCTKCDKSFATNSDLRQHMTVHGEGKVFECEECGRT